MTLFIYFLIVNSINLIMYANVGFYDNGNLIMQREEVTKNYLKNIFSHNLITIVIFAISFNYE